MRVCPGCWAGLREVNTQYVAERLQRRVGDGA
ncbi:hypothetical protein HNQ49_002378 [Parapusillimonas granuli]|nr:hypothetical protein [Parapusillimonas granuli]